MPARQQQLMRRAVRLELWSVGWMSLVTLMTALAAGDSQAMKSAWVEDLLSLVPPLALLAAAWFARKPADAEYVNGRMRAFDVTFLVSAVALTGVGLALVYDGLHALLTRKHPGIGAVEVGGTLLWQGWIMVGALLLSVLPPVVLGRKKLAVARELQLKPLRTDADMNKADWMTGLAGVAGIFGIGMGWWWADAVAALFISGSVLHDGASNLKAAMRDLHDAHPETLERGQPDPLCTDVRAAVAALPWVSACDVRLHEEGPRLCGVLLLAARAGEVTPAQLREAEDTARAVHWRVDEVTARPHEGTGNRDR